MKFGIVPPEPPVIASLTGLAPRFRASVEQVLTTMQASGQSAKVAESLRTAERQAWQWGMGRSYDDGRGIVTDAPTARSSWHFYGLAVDIVAVGAEWDAKPAFWRELVRCAALYGLTSGLAFSSRTLRDAPHVQWGNGMRLSPSPHAYALFLGGGVQAVWRAVGAVS